MDAIQAARDQSLFREVNERVRVIHESFKVIGRAEFWCECARRDCMKHVSMTLDAYEELRSSPAHFAVTPGHDHVFPEVDRLFETNNGYWVVERFGEAGLAAIKLDPRSRANRVELGRTGLRDHAALSKAVQSDILTLESIRAAFSSLAASGSKTAKVIFAAGTSLLENRRSQTA